ncbi:type II toxin-antitoxin system VapC family toxin [Streptomyces sp. ISL-90]|nr:type II toxin-antitoxin system VapC family toxin [Streptomyces sp. ISL-90]
MIALDASVVIAHLSSHDAHHAVATRFFRTHLDDEFIVHTLTLTEILVGPIRVGRAALAEQQLALLAVGEWMPEAGSATRLARLRVETGLKLPDCCVLDAAMTTRAELATLDRALSRAAASVGVPVIDIQDAR